MEKFFKVKEHGSTVKTESACRNYNFHGDGVYSHG